MLINHLINSLRKLPKKARPAATLTQPTSMFRQEVCGYENAIDCHTINADIDLSVFQPTTDRREPLVADIWDYTTNRFLFPPGE